MNDRNIKLVLSIGLLLVIGGLVYLASKRSGPSKTQVTGFGPVAQLVRAPGS